MNRKIIISFIIIVLTIVLSLIVVFMIPLNVKELVVENYVSNIKLNFGKCEVKGYSSEYYYNQKHRLNFTVESKNEFYNNFIKNNEFYDSNLEFAIDGYYAFGYIIKENCVFHYEMVDDNVTLEASFGSYQIINSTETLETTDYFIPGPFDLNMSSDSLNSLGLEFYYMLDKIDFLQLCQILSKLSKELVKFENESLYLKGIAITSGQNIISDKYLIHVYNDNNVIKVIPYD